MAKQTVETTDTLNEGRVKINENFTELYPAFAAWTPAFTGFSDTPSAVTARHARIGNLGILYVNMAGTGTSNATTFTITNAPYTAANTISEGSLWWTGLDNSAALNTPGRVLIAANTTTITINKTMDGATGWTASGNKRVAFTLIYEIA